MEQEPIRIVIMYEEQPIVHVAERGEPSLAEKVQETGKSITTGARSAWERVPEEEIRAATHTGVQVSRRGAARGLRWLSHCLATLAERLRPQD